MPSRDIIKIAVEPDAKRSIDLAAQRYGMSQIELASRVYQWFAYQDEAVQVSILDLLPRGIRSDVARLLLERMADETPSAKAAKRAGKTVHVNRRKPKP